MIFARELFNVEPPDRESWLQKKLDDFLAENKVSKEKAHNLQVTLNYLHGKI
jgi:hypothetical protein